MSEPRKRVSNNLLNELASAAWKARENAYVVGTTPVGCAVLSDRGEIFTGCNVEHRYRCHDVHAEVNAITTMVASGSRNLKAIVIVAERDQFTPCGGCMDWIFQFAQDDCVVAFQPTPGATLVCYTPQQLMPHYPG